MTRLKWLTACLSFVAVSVVVGPFSSAAAEPDPLAEIEQRQQELFESLVPSVVFISRQQAFGSGFFIAGDGTILTNAHVVGDANTVDIVLHDGRSATGEVVKRAKNLDLAIVETDLENVKAVELAGMNDLK